MGVISESSVAGVEVGEEESEEEDRDFSEDLRIGLLVVLGGVVEIGAIESMWVHSDCSFECIEHGKDSSFNLAPHCLQLLPSTIATYRGEMFEFVALLKTMWVLSQYG